MLKPGKGAIQDLCGVSAITVFDNNVYRDLTDGIGPGDLDDPVARLRAAERSAGIQALAHPIVLTELVARLPADTAVRQPARSALTAAALHCSLSSGQMGLLADPELEMARSFFAQDLTDNLDVTEKLAIVCKRESLAPATPSAP